MGYYSALTRNEVLIQTTMRMHFKKHVTWKKVTYGSKLCEIFRTGKFIEMEDELLQRPEEGKNGSNCLMAIGFPLEVINIFYN